MPVHAAKDAGPVGDYVLAQALGERRVAALDAGTNDFDVEGPRLPEGGIAKRHGAVGQEDELGPEFAGPPRQEPVLEGVLTFNGPEFNLLPSATGAAERHQEIGDDQMVRQGGVPTGVRAGRVRNRREWQVRA